MFEKIAGFCKKVVEVVSKPVVATVTAVTSYFTIKASPAMAALDATQQTAIQTGITGSDAVFYAIGGTVLIVLAGIWGFKKVQGLLSSR